MFFLYFTIIAITIIIVLSLSKIQFEVRDLRIFANVNKIQVEPHYKLFIKFFILKKLKILDKQIKQADFKNQKRFKKFQDIIKNQSVNSSIDSKILQPKIIKNANINLKNSNIKIEIGTENAALTAILTGAFYGIIPIVLSSFFEIDKDINFRIQPIYQNKNQISFSFDGIFEIDLIHIINTYKVLIGKDKEEKNNGTSNRESYAYNNG